MLRFVFSSVILQIEKYTSKIVNPTIQLESSCSRVVDGLNEKASLGLITSNSSVS